MLTHLATYLLSCMAELPVIALYALVALWAGADCAGLPIPMEPALLFLGALVAEGKVILPIAIGIIALAELIFAHAEGKTLTRDLGGTASTDQFTDALIAKLK